MSTYQVAQNHNNAVNLADIDPQPRGTGIHYPDRIERAGIGAVVRGAAYTVLEWNSLTRAQYNTIATAFGISTGAPTKDVTVKIRKNDDTFANFNATAVLSDTDRAAYFWKNVQIELWALEAL